MQSYYPRSVRLRFLSAEAIAGLADGGWTSPALTTTCGRCCTGTPSGPTTQRWRGSVRTGSPVADARRRSKPRRSDSRRSKPAPVPPGPPEPAPEPRCSWTNAAALSGPPGWSSSLEDVLAVHVARQDRLNLEALARPFAARHFAGHQAFADAVHAYLQADARGSAAGEDDPLKMAIGALNAGRAVLKSVVCDGGITDESWLGELRGWFESFVEGLASGPPALRVEQLAALVREGIVRFVGPDPVFGLDPEQRVFTASSPWVDAPPWRSKDLIEALAPANRVLQNSSPLLEQLLADGLVRPRIMLAADGQPVATSGLDLSQPPYRALDSSGRIVRGPVRDRAAALLGAVGHRDRRAGRIRYPSGYRTLQDADLIAGHILAAGE